MDAREIYLSSCLVCPKQKLREPARKFKYPRGDTAPALNALSPGPDRDHFQLIIRFSSLGLLPATSSFAARFGLLRWCTA